ncbi:SDR family NAD(P)-dependent oxidoreductase [Clostridium sp. NSJ-6]|uniref:SDR family NAD(P)-dependent oxidoreductase n=1 Tax=Clostridium hominis TaxID=2763036 RepID=A0ABR7D9F9_9CLOT|nr:SDR family NAD(P)-dependent oxidoreductase [Clostridium hominis]MBC5627973.1 SDR family NAD(P)-dependent oxidoreductase [Clostridium hominis]
MNFREKYGQWAIVLGATEGIGKADAFELARRGMDVILVGRRREALENLAKDINAETGSEVKVLCQDLSEYDAADKIIEATKDLDMGLVNYVACLHSMGQYNKVDYSKYEQMYRVNIRTFSKLLHHFIGLFKERDRGAFVTIGSLSGWTSLPFCAEYAAQKAYMMALTEGVAYECKNTNVDVLLLTAGSTITPTWLKNKPADEDAVAAAMYPEDVSREGFDQLGKKLSYLAGERNRINHHKRISEHDRDEIIEELGKMFTHMA